MSKEEENKENKNDDDDEKEKVSWYVAQQNKTTNIIKKYNIGTLQIFISPEILSMTSKERKRIDKVYYKREYTDTTTELQKSQKVYEKEVALQNKQKEQKEIHHCLFFGSNAERAIKFLQKGTHVHLTGTLHYETRENTDHTKSFFVNVKVQEFTVSDRIMVSKEMYEKIFPGQAPYRAELAKQRYEMENFDEDAARIDRITRMRGMKNAK